MKKSVAQLFTESRKAAAMFSPAIGKKFRMYDEQAMETGEIDNSEMVVKSVSPSGFTATFVGMEDEDPDEFYLEPKIGWVYGPGARGLGLPVKLTPVLGGNPFGIVSGLGGNPSKQAKRAP